MSTAGWIIELSVFNFSGLVKTIFESFLESNLLSNWLSNLLYNLLLDNV